MLRACYYQRMPLSYYDPNVPGKVSIVLYFRFESQISLRLTRQLDLQLLGWLPFALGI